MLAAVLLVCCSSAGYPTPPRAGELTINTLLIDLHVREPFFGTTRYVVTYTTGEGFGRLLTSGRTSGTRKLPGETIGRLASLVLESGVLMMEDQKRTCDDCRFWELQIRLNERENVALLTDLHDVSKLVTAVEEAAR